MHEVHMSDHERGRTRAIVAQFGRSGACLYQALNFPCRERQIGRSVLPKMNPLIAAAQYDFVKRTTGLKGSGSDQQPEFISTRKMVGWPSAYALGIRRGDNRTAGMGRNDTEHAAGKKFRLITAQRAGVQEW
jgi:hypothetical protein